MAFQRVTKFAKKLEDPENPLLGPTLKGLYLFGLWQTGSKFHTTMYNMLHFSMFIFVITQFVDLYNVRSDIPKLLDNFSLTSVNFICMAKSYSYVIWQPLWKQLAQEISELELTQMRKQDKAVLKLMKKYTKYTRIITYMFWIYVVVGTLLMILSPFLRYFSSISDLDDVEKDLVPLPTILYSWFPFDISRMPGYLGAVLVHLVMGCQAAGIIAVYDMNAVALMAYLKGQMQILRETCKTIFDEATSRDDVVNRIKECHRHHNILLKHYKMFNGLMSPIKFLYVLLCSATICCSVIQLSLKETTIYQKVWVVPYTTGQINELFFYCWHSTELTVESGEVDQGVYESDWWKADVPTRRQILLLAGKLNQPLTLYAGPFTTLSMSTFINVATYLQCLLESVPDRYMDILTGFLGNFKNCAILNIWFVGLAFIFIMKGTYSFYTLFSQMEDK